CDKTTNPIIMIFNGAVRNKLPHNTSKRLFINSSQGFMNFISTFYGVITDSLRKITIYLTALCMDRGENHSLYFIEFTFISLIPFLLSFGEVLKRSFFFHFI